MKLRFTALPGTDLCMALRPWPHEMRDRYCHEKWRVCCRNTKDSDTLPSQRGISRQLQILRVIWFMPAGHAPAGIGRVLAQQTRKEWGRW